MSHPMTPTEMRDTPTEEAMREAVARIIDPTAWEEYLLEDGRVDTEVSAIFQDAYEDSLAKADQILALLSVQPSRPQGEEGWRLVPVELTEAMIEAYCEAHQSLDFHAWAGASFVWPRILAAAPAPSTHGEGV